MNKDLEKITAQLANKLSKKSLLKLISMLALLGYKEEEGLCEKIYFDRFLTCEGWAV